MKHAAERFAGLLCAFLIISVAGVATAGDAETRTTVFHVEGMT